MKLIKTFSAIGTLMFLLSACSNTYNITSGLGKGTKIAGSKNTEENTVFFDYDKAELSKHSQAKLDKQIKWLSMHPKVRAIVEGHCDERGTEEYNMALGERRAMGVIEYLAYYGIDIKRLKPISYGKAKPVANGHDEESWKHNRRAVIVIDNN